jgi:hypothetical protein
MIDNADTMKEHWDEATFLLDILVSKVVGQDKDGIDLQFTNGEVSIKQKKGDSAFKTALGMKNTIRIAMEKANPAVLLEAGYSVETNMNDALSPILDKFRIDAERKQKLMEDQKYKTVIVLTDGIWAAMGEDRDMLRRNLVDFGTKLKALGIFAEGIRPLSIEFIQLGDDHTALETFRELDNNLGRYEIEYVYLER